MVLVDGLPAASIPTDDRGFAYGDGVFRTLAVRGGAPEFWSWHRAKLAADCSALALTPPAESDLLRDICRVAAEMPDCALRITVTRGSGGRGYQMPGNARSRRIVAAAALPRYPAAYAEQGVRTRICKLRLAPQPRLAGIKHLNRLENVLARAEWHDPNIVEGLMLDVDGNIICGTRSNLFIVEDGHMTTPDLTRCGVAGVTRDLVIESARANGIRCDVAAISRARLESADEIILVNSLIGVWAVAALETHHWTHFSLTPLVRKWLDALRASAR